MKSGSQLTNFYGRIISLKKAFTEVRLAKSEIDEESMWTEYPEQLSIPMQRGR